MIVITGWRSAIAVEFRRIIGVGEMPQRGDWLNDQNAFPLHAERYLFCQGLLRPKRFHEQTADEVREGYRVNCASVIGACEAIFACNDRARVCIIGSESGYRGSFDGTYAAAKGDLHGYVERKAIGPHQQLVAISPDIIGDAGMTMRRSDADNLERRRLEHPKGRFLSSAEVAEMAKFLLFGSDYVTGTIVRMHGGRK